MFDYYCKRVSLTNCLQYLMHTVFIFSILAIIIIYRLNRVSNKIWFIKERVVFYTKNRHLDIVGTIWLDERCEKKFEKKRIEIKTKKMCFSSDFYQMIISFFLNEMRMNFFFSETIASLYLSHLSIRNQLTTN